MIASHCIQDIQKDIKSGKKKAYDFIPGPVSEDKAKELYNAWRVYFIDRMMQEYEEKKWGNTMTKNPTNELEYDIEYYKGLVEKEKEKNKK